MRKLSQSGETKIVADGETYEVHFDWNTACDIESITDGNISDVLRHVANSEFNVTTCRAVLWAGLQKHHPNVKLRDAGELIEMIGRTEAMRVQGVALRFYFPELAAAAADAAPQAQDGAGAATVAAPAP